MNVRILNYINYINNEELRDAVYKYMVYHDEKFSEVPASIKFHHTYTGGLVDHVIEMIELGMMIIQRQNLEDRVNRDHFVMTALLHDIAKVDRYEWNDEKNEWGYSKLATGIDPQVVMVGRADHSVYPLIDFPMITGVALPREVAIAILGHMGGFSVTSVKPDTLLDVIVSATDHISSRLHRHGDEVPHG